MFGRMFTIIVNFSICLMLQEQWLTYAYVWPNDIKEDGVWISWQKNEKHNNIMLKLSYNYISTKQTLSFASFLRNLSFLKMFEAFIKKNRIDRMQCKFYIYLNIIHVASLWS